MAQLPDSLAARILIVDDHPNTATMLARVLTRLHHSVEIFTAASGEDALDQVCNQPVDIVITDFVMPGMNGLELITRLNNESKTKYTILITAYDIPGLSISAKRLGVKDYLVKPVQPDKIQAIVSRAIDELNTLTSPAHNEK
jgi:YesN/AraC family two-component response regulator